jgi:hypothetical protein
VRTATGLAQRAKPSSVAAQTKVDEGLGSVRACVGLRLGQLVAAFGLDDVAGLGEFAQGCAGALAWDPGRLGDLAGCLRAVLERFEDPHARLTARRRRPPAPRPAAGLAVAVRLAAVGDEADVLGAGARRPRTRAPTPRSSRPSASRSRSSSSLRSRCCRSCCSICAIRAFHRLNDRTDPRWLGHQSRSGIDVIPNPMTTAAATRCVTSRRPTRDFSHHCRFTQPTTITAFGPPSPPMTGRP